MSRLIPARPASREARGDRPGAAGAPGRDQAAQGPGTARRRPARPGDLAHRGVAGARQAQPAVDDPHPGHVPGRGGLRHHHRRVRRPAQRVRGPGHPLAVGHRAVRQLRRGGRRRPRQGPGGHAPQGPQGHGRLPPQHRWHDGGRPVHPARGRRPVRRGREPGHPRRRRRHRGHRGRRRVGDHRRVRPGAPRVGRRQVRGDRRHRRAQRPDRRPHHVPAGRDVPGPDDRAGRGCQPAEDARTRSPSTSSSLA